MTHSRRFPFRRPSWALLSSAIAFALGLSAGVIVPSSAAAQSSSQELRIDHSLRSSLWAPGAVARVGNNFFVGPNSYQAATINSGGFSRPATRPFFVFDLSASTDRPGSIVGAKLRLFHPSTSLSENIDPTETITFHDLRTPVAALRALESPPIDPNTGRRRAATEDELGVLGAIFADLGDGPAFGSMTASASNQGAFQEVQLNQAALTSLNNARVAGQEWALGGTLSSIDTTGTHPVRSYERIFRDSQDQQEGGPRPATELVLTFGPVRPAPVLGGFLGFSLLGTGLVGMSLRRRQRS